MKPIELTEEHKTKLLEMCNVLFIPEGNDHIYYSNFRFKPIYNWFDKLVKTTDYIQWINDKNGDIYEIHWFEFCTNTIIIEKLFNRGESLSDIVTNETDDYMYQCILFKNEHPVDYMYDYYLSTLNN